MVGGNKSKDIIPTVLTIAGSDPAGGAGIQADLKTLTALGVYGAAVVTCLTVQNSRGVTRIEPVAPDLLRDQIQAVLEDHFVSHIKIGMVGTARLGQTLGLLLADFPGQVIYDPVMAATTGQSLLQAGSDQKMLESLLATTTVLTPNLPELAGLSGTAIRSHEEALTTARTLFSRMPRLQAVLVKGGHFAEAAELHDYLLLKADRNFEVYQESHPRLPSPNTHGTGCTLASAFAAFHCQTGNYVLSFQRSVRYLETILAHSATKTIVKNKDGHGPMLHFAR